MSSKKKSKNEKLTDSIQLPQGVQASINLGEVRIKGPKGEVVRRLLDPKTNIEAKEDKIIISSPRSTKRDKRTIGTFGAHIRNMIRGVEKPFVYKLKVCSGHFPITVTVGKGDITIKNFLGEKVPRTAKLRQDVSVKLDGDIITVESADKEATGQIAAKIEQLTKVRNRDLRIFQDGIYIIEKDGKAIG